MEAFNIEEDWVDIAPPSHKTVEKEEKAFEESIRKSLGEMGTRQKKEELSTGNSLATSVFTVKEPHSPIARMLKDGPQSSPSIVPQATAELTAEPVSPTESDEEGGEKEDLKTSSLSQNLFGSQTELSESETKIQKEEEEKISTAVLTSSESSSLESSKLDGSDTYLPNFGSALTASVFSPEIVSSAEKAWDLSNSVTYPTSDEESKTKEEEFKPKEEVEEKEEEKKPQEKIIEEIIVETKKEEPLFPKSKIVSRKEGLKGEIDPIFGQLRVNKMTPLPQKDMEFYIIFGSLLTMVVHSFLFSPKCAAF